MRTAALYLIALLRMCPGASSSMAHGEAGVCFSEPCAGGTACTNTNACVGIFWCEYCGSDAEGTLCLESRNDMWCAP